ncbi:MAG: hypothetical protein FWG05_02380 [Kiritimatiellaeota bacterium]|nr:hypothetical protein [Kiritimatiellota bacterium]
MNDDSNTTGDAIKRVVQLRDSATNNSEDVAAETPAPPPINPTPPAPEPDNDIPFSGNIIERLLKAPYSVARMILKGDNLAAECVKMLLAAALCYAVFGFAVGLFGGWKVAATAVWKAPFITICSMLLCFPSLYVFTAVQGSPMTPGRAFALGSACLAMTGLIVVGLAPVAWLFANSTESLPFVMIMTILMWFISLPFAFRFLNHARNAGLLAQVVGLKLWFIVLIAVTLQMTTVMRPILTAPVKDAPRAPEKMFFIKHFTESFN